ncbi:MAG: hypothetical protein HFE78_01920 [Clostridiales bacterium]|nr:hypothetical protein [Clostridiales bacterium]
MENISQAKKKGAFGSFAAHPSFLRLLPVLGITAVALVLMLPLFLGPWRNGYDTLFHIANIDQLYEQLGSNPLFPCPIMSEVGYDLGYGTYLFYPPLSHFVAAYLNFITHDTIVSMQIAHFLFLALSGLTMYWTSLSISGKQSVGFLSALIYMVFPYHMTDIYIRDAFSECALYVFLPLIVLGLHELYAASAANKRFKFYPCFIIGYCGGMLSHLTLMIPFTVLIFLFLLIRIKDTLKKERLLSFITAGLLILAITSPFWTSVLTYKLQGGYSVFSNDTMYRGIEWYGLKFSQYNIMHQFGLAEMKYFIPIPVIVMLLVTLTRIHKQAKPYLLFLFFGIFTFLLTTLYWPWAHMPSLIKMVQFPSRFQLFMFLSLALLVPACFCLCRKRTEQIGTVILAVLLVCSGFQHVSMPASTVDRDHFDYNNGMGWQKEYLPTAANEQIDYLKNRGDDIRIEKGTAAIQITENRTPALRFTVQNSDSPTIELPRLYYLGYTLRDADGNRIALRQNERGLIEAELTKDGDYTFAYTGTLTAKISTVCSLSALLILFAVSLFIIKKRKKPPFISKAKHPSR